MKIKAFATLARIARVFTGRAAPAPAPAPRMPADLRQRAEWARQDARSLAGDVRQALARYSKAKADYLARPNPWRANSLRMAAESLAFGRDRMNKAAAQYRELERAWA